MPVIVSYIQMMTKAKVTQFSENNGKAISRKDLTCRILLHALKHVNLTVVPMKSLRWVRVE